MISIEFDSIADSKQFSGTVRGSLEYHHASLNQSCISDCILRTCYFSRANPVTYPLTNISGLLIAGKKKKPKRHTVTDVCGTDIFEHLSSAIHQEILIYDPIYSESWLEVTLLQYTVKYEAETPTLYPAVKNEEAEYQVLSANFRMNQNSGCCTRNKGECV